MRREEIIVATNFMNVLKTLAGAYIVTCIMLLLLALGLYKFNLSDWQATAGIIVTYALSTFMGGYYLARKEHNRRLLWGIGFGILYFVVLAVASIILNKGIGIEQASALRAAIICIGAAAIGAFATPVEE
jgi:putative membrane protein (TIGR04086 family)